MSTPDIVATNAVRLGEARGAVLRTCSELLTLLGGMLSEPDHAAALEVLGAGGRIGLEVLVDMKGKTTVTLVAIELEGAHRRIADISPMRSAVEH